MSDYVSRMLDEALGRIDDADRLEKSLSPTDTASHLRILGFEILLKCALVVCGERPKHTHCYLRLWNALPPAARDEIVRVANERMPGLINFSDLDGLLAAYQHVFEKARYFYEFDEERSQQEVRKRSQNWSDQGAPHDKADVVYYDDALCCLIAGLRGFVEPRL